MRDYTDNEVLAMQELDRLAQEICRDDRFSVIPDGYGSKEEV